MVRSGNWFGDIDSARRELLAPLVAQSLPTLCQADRLI